MKTYNTIVTSKEVKTLDNVVARAPYGCIELGEGRFGFMDNERGDIRNYFCDTLGYECSNYEAFDFEYFDEPQSVTPSNPDHKTHLQGLGEVPAIKAGELKEGDVIVCNYGYTQTVTQIIKETAKSIFVEIRSDESGKLYETRYLKNRLVAIKERKSVSSPEPSSNQYSDRIAFAKASKAFVQEWRANNPYPGSDHLDEFNAKFNRDYSEFADKYGVSSYLVPSPYPTERGEYKETALDRQKKAADILVESIEGNWYTIRLNREIEIKSKRIRKYDNGCIAVPESMYYKLKSEYNVMCNF